MLFLCQIDDVTPLIDESEDGGGSGFCSTINFLCLLSALGVAVGVIFFELGALQGPLSHLANLDELAEPVVVAVDEEFLEKQTEPLTPTHSGIY